MAFPFSGSPLHWIARPRRPHRMDSPKIRLTAYETMVLLGSFDPKLSERFKAAVDVEVQLPEYQCLPKKRAVTLAFRTLALKSPEVFDMDNRDDRALKTLAPLCIDEKGERLAFEKIRERVEFQDLSIAFHDQGDLGRIEVVAKDDQGQRLSARFSVRMKKRNRKRGRC